MRRSWLRAAALVGTIAVVLLSARASLQQGRGQRLDVQSVGGGDAVAREALVKFRRPLESTNLPRIYSDADADEIEPVGRSGLLHVRSRSLDVETLVARFAGRPDVAYAEPNFVVRVVAPPNDVSFPQLWGLQNLGQAVNGSLPGNVGADIHATQAWDLTVGSTANVVAVVDTGIDYTHPDLAANMWSAPFAFEVRLGNRTVRCAEGTHGFNAIRMTCDPSDDHNHGTHVAGTIGATGNNTLGVAGVNWTTRLMGLKFLDASGSGTVADAINAIEFAIQAKQAFGATSGANVRVLSNSWGSLSFSQALLDAVNAANAADMLFVAGAGNFGISSDILPFYPASYNAPNVVAVAATENTDNLASFSNYGASVHLAAPGVDILSTTIGNGYAFASGTSMATPHVSGAAALVLSRCTLDTAVLKDTIVGSVEAVASLATTTMTGGRLDVNSAIHACIAPPDAPSGLTAVAGDGQVTLAWSSALGATSYDLKRGTVSGGPYTVIGPGLRTVRYTDTAVVNGTTSYYVVSARNALGASGDSNEASATPQPPPDVVVSSLTAPTNVGAGTTIVVSVTTKNQGVGAAGASTTRFYLSDNALFDSGDVLLNGAQIVSTLAPGAVSSASVSIDIPGGLTAGMRYLFAKADADNVLNESQEANNMYLRLLMVGPDLIVSSLTVPTTAAPGATISVSETVKNQGAGDAAASSSRFYLSTNVVLDAGDTQLDGSRSVPELAAGASSPGAATVSIPSFTAAGTYYLFAQADGTSTVAEASELNNTALRAIQIGSDLIVSAFTVPAKGGAGSVISVSDTTTNRGTVTAAASMTRFYLSTNVLLDAADTLLDGSRLIPELAAGASNSGQTPLTIPAGTPVATYYLFAKADADGAVSEAQETNNATLRTIQVGGDLAVSAFTVPSKGGAGASVVVTDTTTNQGGGAISSASVTAFYFSTNALLDASDIALDGTRAIGALAAGASSSGSTAVTIPAGTTPGTYYLMAKADAGGTVTETQESNNAAARVIMIGPDLQISSLSVAYSIAAGLTVSVNSTITNAGAQAAGSSTTRFYLSPNVSLDASDILLAGSLVVPALAPSASSAGSVPVTIPAGIAPGTYYFLAKADADSAVTETQEVNNVTARVVKVTGGS